MDDRKDAAAIRGRSRAVRVLWRLGVAALSLAALYLVGMNLFLRTRAFRDLVNGDPEEIAIEYARGYSILPGRIHVEGLSIRGRDHHVEWILRLDRCDFTVSFLDLARRRFHASRVRGDGLTLRVRLRVDRTATPEHDAALPPVPGFADPPYKDPGPPPAPLTDADYDLWSAQLDDVDAEHVRELWIDTLRMTGDLRVRGRWLFRPVRWLDVGPATVDVAKLDVSYGAHEALATGVSGSLRATVHPFDVRVPDGAEILRFLSVDADLHGQLHTADTLALATPTADVSFAQGEGPFDGRIMVDHGVLAAPTRLQNDMAAAELGVAGITVRAGVHLELEAKRGDAGQPSATLLVRAAGLDASRADGAQASVASCEASFTSQELDLARAPAADVAFVGELHDAALSVGGPSKPSLHVEAPVVTLRSAHLHRTPEGPEGDVSIDIRRAETTDLRPVGLLLALPKNLTIAGGRASLSLRADVDLPSRTIVADGELIARDLAVQAGARSLNGILKLQLRARRRGERTILSGSTLAFDSTGPTATDASASWWARADLVDAELSEGGLHFRGKVHLKAKDASPLVAMIGADTAVPTWVADDVPLHGLEAESELRLSPTRLEVRSLTAHGGSDTVELEYARQTSPPPSTEWALLVEAGPIHVAVRGGDEGTKLVLFGARPWYDRMASGLRARESATW